MTAAGRDARDVRRTVAFGALGVVAVACAAVLPAGGPAGTVRTVLGCIALLIVPGWLLGRVLDEQDAVARLAVGAVASLCGCVVLSFLAVELGLRVATGVYGVAVGVLVVVATVAAARRPGVATASLAPLAVAAALSAAALLGAAATHLALPEVPVEPSFSLEAATATATSSEVTVTVTVSRVRLSGPAALILEVDGVHAATPLAAGEGTVRLTARLPAGAGCPSAVDVLAPDGAYLSPPVTCVGR